ncbi:coniferyl aldehyde dehydrogenase [Pseudomonas kulmbachensis]|uniref:coniferyl aldehyde dehydrogenase n=1 Tax=Pseudomonas kulmbachensis TaxID=3043408 RepID=UPI003754017C
MTFSSTAPEQLPSLLAAQKQAFVAAGPVSAELRRARIQRVIELLVSYQQPLIEAMDADFGGRPQGFSLMNDVLGSLASLKYARDHLEHWVEDEPRQVFSPYDQMGAKAWVMHQPKGTIGILGTWNAPLFTLLSPLACVLAAGNRAILKPSEVVPRTAQVLAQAFAEWFDPLEIALVTGDAELAQVFTAQPFDHLVFTGSTAVARSVMRNAAENLVPLTLELGGKSPVIISRSADMSKAAFSIAVAKANNGGQICINPDLVYVPREQMEDFIDLLGAAYSELLPTTQDNPDVVAVVNARHLQRIEGYVQDARARGARVESYPQALEADAGSRRRPLQVVINPPCDSQVMREEIFGPALVVLPYEQLQSALDDIHSRERPLALYYFGQSEEEQRHVLQNTISGGVSINDVMMHAALHDAPFGGIGASGMGHYHGREGFLEFSHMRSVYKAPPHDPRREWGLLPPYGEHFLPTMQSMVTAY